MKGDTTFKRSKLMVEVYLRKIYDFNFIFEENAVIMEVDYEKVAEIDCHETLDRIFEITQNIKTGRKKEKLFWFFSKRKKCRPSNFGDIFCIDNQLNLILPLGYQSIKWGDTVTIKPDFFNKPSFKTPEILQNSGRNLLK